MQEQQFSSQQLKAATELFKKECIFLRGVVSIDDIPPGDKIEVAFAGRSNVGKSSLLNSLTYRRDLARTSNTPGRTRELNYFSLSDSHYIVDMPGYGYARAEKAKVKLWNDLIRRYLLGRANLRRVFLLIDSRHGLKKADIEIMELMDEAAVSYQIVLTKIDKRTDLKKITNKLLCDLKNHSAAFPEIHQTSSLKKLGIIGLQAEIANL